MRETSRLKFLVVIEFLVKVSIFAGAYYAMLKLFGPIDSSAAIVLTLIGIGLSLDGRVIFAVIGGVLSGLGTAAWWPVGIYAFFRAINFIGKLKVVEGLEKLEKFVDALDKALDEDDLEPPREKVLENDYGDDFL